MASAGHRWGRSFRPADNGTVYDYYIRLRSKTGTKPAPGVVEAFLKEALPPRETLTGESERELAQDDAPNSSAAHRSILNNGTKNPKSWNSCSKTKSGVTKI